MYASVKKKASLTVLSKLGEPRPQLEVAYPSVACLVLTALQEY